MEMTFEQLRSLLERDRSVRRFKQDIAVGREVLESLVGLTTLCASGRNLQPLKYRLVNTPAECDSVYPSLKWAGYYTDWDGPEPGQRPAAYIVQCLDTGMTGNLLCDDGLHIQAITLGATALGLSCCVIKAFNVADVASALHLPAGQKPLYVIALGVADEQVRLVPMRPGDDFKYYRDSNDNQCVPKRPLHEILIRE